MTTAAIYLAAVLLLTGTCTVVNTQDAISEAVPTADIISETDPNGENIDEEAFKARFLIDGEEVSAMVAEAEAIEEDGSSFVSISASDALVPRPIPRCENGPITTIFRKPGFWYWPRIRVRRCRPLPCPNNSPCLARKTVTRNVWAICYKRFNCWGLILWIPIGIKRLCVVDELDCECKKCSDIDDFKECVTTRPCPNETNPNTFCYWKPCKLPDKKDIDDFAVFDPSTPIDKIANSIVDPRIWGCCDCCKVTPCPHGQFFDRRICMCRCKRIACKPPFVQDQRTCRCVCPLKFDCGPHRRWNPHLCRCECKRFFCFPPRKLNITTCDCECPQIYCQPPLQLDPSSCQCRCPKNISIICPRPKIFNHQTCRCECPNVCPHGSYQDPNTCKCVGNCLLFTTQQSCRAVNSCSINRNERCRWFPTFPQNRCQCECCQPRPQFPNVDCGQFSPFGKFTCNFYYHPPSGTQTCQWVCP